MAHHKSATQNGLRMQSSLSKEDGSNPATTPLAIVGIACRFAGGVTSPEKLWEFVSKGKNAWSMVPEERFNMPAFHHDQPDRYGRVSTEIRVPQKELSQGTNNSNVQ